MMLRPSSINQIARQNARYLLLDNFPTPQSAPLTTPRTCAPGGGHLIITDTSNRLSVAGGDLVLAAGAAAAFAGSQLAYDFAPGRVYRAYLKQLNAGRFDLGASLLNTNPSASCRFEFTTTTQGIRQFNGAFHGLLPLPSSEIFPNFYSILRVLGGKAYFFVGNKLVWITADTNTAPRFIVASGEITNWSWLVSQLAIFDLSEPFTTGLALANLNVSVPTSQIYNGNSNFFLEITFTAPAIITSECGIIYRRLDANNYWRAYFDTAGAFKIDNVSAGVATNWLAVAGVIAGGQTLTVRLIVEGGRHTAYTIDGTTITTRTVAINVNYLNAQSDLLPDIGSGWTAANLINYPRQSLLYNPITYGFL